MWGRNCLSKSRLHIFFRIANPKFCCVAVITNMQQSGRTVCSRWLRNVFSLGRDIPPTRLPLFLCPALQTSQAESRYGIFRRRNLPLIQTQKLHAQTQTQTASEVESTQHHNVDKEPAKALPFQCSGCGALAQTTVPDLPGHFDLQRRAVKQYLGLEKRDEAPSKPRKSDVLSGILDHVNLDELQSQGVNLSGIVPEPKRVALPSSELAPICDRCHHLLHHNTGAPIYHPSVDSLRETIFESPFKYNHIYHVLDAADFPMSLVPRIAQLLDTAPLRSHNRRSRSAKYYADRKTELHFIITRSDLLAPTKDQVDGLMPYLRDTLRDALGRSARDVRLGNVRCVSAKRSWWTKELKDEIYDRGGAGWMVGKANVGKSNLFSAVFPKGRMDDSVSRHNISVDLELVEALGRYTAGRKEEMGANDDGLSLLPPVQPEIPYPAMPLVSPLPGTTASPIRLSFGSGKGELIDLPGLPRSNLDSYVQVEHRASLIMRKRIVPEQQTLKPGKSLLLGGFIRLTPQNPSLVVLAYNFTPLKDHVTSTEKAVGIQQRTSPVNVENISTPEASEKIKLAGSFQLRHDVTKQRAGPLTRKNSVNLTVEQLPFRVLAIDILIEGCGWVELVAQVRSRDLEPRLARRKEEVDDFNPERLESLDLSIPEPQPSEPNWPVIDVFTPEGRFVTSRRPMNGWLLNKPRQTKTMKRPRRSMKGAKRMAKARRAVTTTETFGYALN